MVHVSRGSFSCFFLISLRGTQSLRNSHREVLDALKSFQQQPGTAGSGGAAFGRCPPTTLKGTQPTVLATGSKNQRGAAVEQDEATKSTRNLVTVSLDRLITHYWEFSFLASEMIRLVTKKYRPVFRAGQTLNT